MAGVEEDLRRLIWQIAITGKYISAKIHESNRKLAGFKNLYGRISSRLTGAPTKSSRPAPVLGFCPGVRLGGAGRGRHDRQGPEKYYVTADPLDGSSLVDTNLAIGTIIGIHKESIFARGCDSMVAALYITYGP